MDPVTRNVLTLADLRADVVGIGTRVRLLDGSWSPYVFLDNAASTPTFRSVMQCIEDFMPWYSGVHRGTGIKSIIATELFDRAHEVIGEFVGADPDDDVVILGKNTTEAINKLGNRLGIGDEDVVITTVMEHHSNDLPWRRRGRLAHIGVEDDGHLKLDELRDALRKFRGRVKLVAVNGASNITGICNPIHDIARWAHEAGARIFVDAAQLAPHRPIDVLPHDNPGHLDFLAFSAHKMYAPFGTGVLIGPRAVFEKGDPDMVGGGVVTAVSLDQAYWTRPPEKEEAGSPNVVGAIALAKAISILREVGMETIVEHETSLLGYAYDRLKKIPGIVFYGPTDDLSDKVGVIAFNIEGLHNALVPAICGLEGGIGLRNGCFCAHPYVKRMLKISPEEDRRLTNEMISGDKTNIPGMVRASLGCYNTEEDVDALVAMLERIVRRNYAGTYSIDRATGTFSVQGYRPHTPEEFAFLRPSGARGSREYSEAS